MRREPENRTGSCGMIVKRDLNLASPINPMFWSSMVMDPEADSIIRKSAKVNEDLPAPVRPTIPIFSPLIMWQSIPWGQTTLACIFDTSFSIQLTI